MSMKYFRKISTKQYFLLNSVLRRLQCNSLFQLHFDYAFLGTIKEILMSVKNTERKYWYLFFFKKKITSRQHICETVEGVEKRVATKVTQVKTIFHLWGHLFGIN